mmetsp:Transcript_63908/g.176499  ORF Transcript_63908/g.176499 Transcript_63908/m.176499 type:complete len:443 (-) Transcript_63908:991-2319(-)
MPNPRTPSPRAAPRPRTAPVLTDRRGDSEPASFGQRAPPGTGPRPASAHSPWLYANAPRLAPLSTAHTAATNAHPTRGAPLSVLPPTPLRLIRWRSSSSPSRPRHHIRFHIFQDLPRPAVHCPAVKLLPGCEILLLVLHSRQPGRQPVYSFLEQVLHRDYLLSANVIVRQRVDLLLVLGLQRLDSPCHRPRLLQAHLRRTPRAVKRLMQLGLARIAVGKVGQQLGDAVAALLLYRADPLPRLLVLGQRFEVALALLRELGLHRVPLLVRVCCRRLIRVELTLPARLHGGHLLFVLPLQRVDLLPPLVIHRLYRRDRAVAPRVGRGVLQRLHRDREARLRSLHVGLGRRLTLGRAVARSLGGLELLRQRGHLQLERVDRVVLRVERGLRRRVELGVVDRLVPHCAHLDARRPLCEIERAERLARRVAARRHVDQHGRARVAAE